ncbi:hypothetical protein [Roseibium sp.]
MTRKFILRSAAFAAAIVVLPASVFAQGAGFTSLARSQGDLIFLKPGASIDAPVAGASHQKSNPGFINIGTDRSGRLLKVGQSPIDAPVAGSKGPKSREGYRKIYGNGSIERPVGR